MQKQLSLHYVCSGLTKDSSPDQVSDTGATEYLWKVQVTTKVGLVKNGC